MILLFAMTHRYDIVTIIYNPASTNNSSKQITDLKHAVQKLKISVKVIATPTKYAGHAFVIAKNAALSSSNPLIISVSGDGGFHEVINGVIAGNNKRAVCSVEGSGNANDHWRTVHDRRSIVDRLHKPPKKIAVLKLQINGPLKKIVYAHSYIGLGLSAKVAQLLNRSELNGWIEKKILFKAILNNRSFRIRIEDRNHKLESLIAGNINEMAKQLKLKNRLDLKNKAFSLMTHHHSSRWKIILRMIGLALKPDYNSKNVNKFQGHLLTSAWLQCDGETTYLPKNSTVTITRKRDAIQTI